MPFVAIEANYQKPPPANRYTLGVVVLFSLGGVCVGGSQGIHFQDGQCVVVTLGPKAQKLNSNRHKRKKVRRICRASSKKRRKNWGASWEEGRGCQGFAFAFSSLGFALLSCDQVVSSRC